MKEGEDIETFRAYADQRRALIRTSIFPGQRATVMLVLAFAMQSGGR